MPTTMYKSGKSCTVDRFQVPKMKEAGWSLVDNSEALAQRAEADAKAKEAAVVRAQEEAEKAAIKRAETRAKADADAQLAAEAAAESAAEAAAEAKDEADAQAEAAAEAKEKATAEVEVVKAKTTTKDVPKTSVKKVTEVTTTRRRSTK